VQQIGAVLREQGIAAKVRAEAAAAKDHGPVLIAADAGLLVLTADDTAVAADEAVDAGLGDEEDPVIVPAGGGVPLGMAPAAIGGGSGGLACAKEAADKWIAMNNIPHGKFKSLWDSFFW